MSGVNKPTKADPLVYGKLLNFWPSELMSASDLYPHKNPTVVRLAVPIPSWGWDDMAA